MSKIEVNTVEPQCGTTLTLGGSGDTVALGSGASQTGFGRTGTVDWQTGSIKTTTFTAVNGEGYFANTSGAAFTMNLPAGSAGAIVSVVDYTNTFQTYNLTVAPNGSEKIGGVAAPLALATEGQSVTFVYVDGVEGWKNVQDSTSNAIGNAFLQASGGAETTCGDDKIHTFLAPGTFTVSATAACASDNIVSYMVVAGGGGSGEDNYAGGGGAGGFRELKNPVNPYTASPLDGYPTPGNRITVTATPYPITVGGGGAGGGDSGKGAQGCSSTFATIVSAGGGGGGKYVPGQNGGTAGGSGGGGSSNAGLPGAGNTPPTTPAPGFNGAAGTGSSGGGGGGATSVGSCGGPSGSGSCGGTGATTGISPGLATKSKGGKGAGSSTPAVNGGDNTGDGGCRSNPGTFPNGGSGIVIIRYKYQ